MRPSRDTSLHALNCSGRCNRGEIGRHGSTHGVKKRVLGPREKYMYRAFTASRGDISVVIAAAKESYSERCSSAETRASFASKRRSIRNNLQQFVAAAQSYDSRIRAKYFTFRSEGANGTEGEISDVRIKCNLPSKLY